MTKRIRLVVAGIEYYINTDETESYMRAVGEAVSSRVAELEKNSPCLSTTMAAVLCALQYCDDCNKLNEELAALRAQLKQVQEESACAGLESDEAIREIERLNKENIRLRNLINSRK